MTALLVDRWVDVHRRASAWSPPRVPTLVVVPHPDDEALATGALIAYQRSRNVEVTVLAVTDGEAAYPDLDADLGAIRVNEQMNALRHLGVAPSAIRRLALPDGQVAHHLPVLQGVIAELAATHSLVIAPWVKDHHVDHEACGRAISGLAGCDVAYSVFWAWHHRTPAALRDWEVLALPATGMIAERRHSAIACHQSQTTHCLTAPMLSEVHLQSARWNREYYLRPVVGERT